MLCHISLIFLPYDASQCLTELPHSILHCVITTPHDWDGVFGVHASPTHHDRLVFVSSDLLDVQLQTLVRCFYFWLVCCPRAVYEFCIVCTNELTFRNSVFLLTCWQISSVWYQIKRQWLWSDLKATTGTPPVKSNYVNCMFCKCNDLEYESLRM